MEGYRMTFKVVHVRQRGGASAKRVVDLNKTAPNTLARMSPETPKPPGAKPEPKQEFLYITAAPDGPPIAADLPEKLRKIEGGPVQKPLTDKQVDVLDRITQKAGGGHITRR